MTAVPDRADRDSRLGWARLADGDVTGAVAAFRAALATSPNDPEALTGMGSALRQQGQLRDAILHCDAAIRAAQGYAPAWLERAFVFTAGGSIDPAFDCYARAAALDPQCADAWAGMASISARRGDRAAVREQAGRALGIAPGNAIASFALATIEIDEGDAPQAARRMDALVTTMPAPSPERAVALNLLGDALDRADDPDAAFDAYARGKADFAHVHSAQVAARGQTQRDFIDGITEALAAIDDTTGWALPEPHAVAVRHAFLLGYPRSGTTLVETILAAMPDTTALEERPTLREADQAFLTGTDGMARLAALDGADAAPFRKAYWDRVAAGKATPPDGGTFVDMDPLKATRLPIIARLFPAAKIVVMRRDPRDVVWSCFHTNFALTNSALEFTDLERTARHYDAMMRLTEACLERLPIAAHILRYDALVADFDRTTQALCAFIGVPWREDLRDFSRTKRAQSVTTASAAQVRKPLYDGTRQWERYARHLAPVLPILAPWIERYGFDQ